MAKFSNVGKIDEKLRQERRASEVARQDKAVAIREGLAMRAEERSQRSRTFFLSGSQDVFFMKVKAFLRVAVFINAKRDYMVCVCKAKAMRTYAPLLFKERDLVAAMNEYAAGSRKDASTSLQRE